MRSTRSRCAKRNMGLMQRLAHRLGESWQNSATWGSCSAWRTASGSEGNAIHPEQVAWAELFEDALQSLRLQRLRRTFGEAVQVRFAPRECTLQDRCLVASVAPLPPGLWAHSLGHHLGESDGSSARAAVASASAGDVGDAAQAKAAATTVAFLEQLRSATAALGFAG